MKHIKIRIVKSSYDTGGMFWSFRMEINRDIAGEPGKIQRENKIIINQREKERSGFESEKKFKFESEINSEQK